MRRAGVGSERRAGVAVGRAERGALLLVQAPELEGPVPGWRGSRKETSCHGCTKRPESAEKSLYTP